jgi:hypothetical protein
MPRTLTGIVILTQLRPISAFFNLPQQNLPELTRSLSEGTLPIDALGADGKTSEASPQTSDSCMMASTWSTVQLNMSLD